MANEINEIGDVKVEVVAPDGLGYGTGSISLNDRLGLPAKDSEHVQELQLIKLENFIHSPDVLVRVDAVDPKIQLDDDGCGDGRGVNTTFVKNGDQLEHKSRSLHRAKIFGGGPVMAGASLLANESEVPSSVEALFLAGIDRLQAYEIDFGGHTDGHASEEKSGCGAIDNAPAIVRNAVTFQGEITDSLSALGVPTDGVESIFDSYRELSRRANTQTYAGQKVMHDIIGNQKVVKELAGGHREVAVILNDVSGYTVNQSKVRELSNDSLQVFAVDIWRLQNLARRLCPSDRTGEQKALQSMLIYTLATAATLTKGDLPVYRVSAEPAAVTA
ncbi:MAG: hypothetical protein U5L95_01305 [Candidatus Saccharibacteria bacterium]|nr:hypothetical protein [Candidatus Saccharibacteria bacterium]